MTGWLLLVLALALLLASWLSAVHLSLLSASVSALERELAERQKLERGRWIFDRMDELAASVSLLRTFMRIVVFAVILVWLSGLGEESRLEWPELLIAAAVSSVLVWVVTSVVAGAIARHAGEGTIVVSLAPLRLIHLIGLPFTLPVRIVDEAVRRLSGANLRAEEAEEELLRSIEDTQRQGGLDDLAARMMENVVEFVDTDVSSVMTPRTEIEGIEYTDDLAAIRAFILDAGHSRIPVYRENLDRIEGILYVKDLVPFLGQDASDFSLEQLLRQPRRVPETKAVGELLRDFQRAEVHLAIVIDEYGGTSGLVTIEDVLEEIVGEIHDEHEPEHEELPGYSPLAEGRWVFDGRFPIAEFEDIAGVELDEDLDAETVGGFLLERHGRVPETGETWDELGLRFSVAASTATRVDRIVVERIDVVADEAGSTDAAGGGAV